jgi:hypothetical protein
MTMIRNLARCPYCGGGEVALEVPSLALDPGGEGRPCPHLAWVDGRYAEWEVSPQGVDRIVGSTEFRWEPPAAGSAAQVEGLLPYLRELARQGKGWPFAPPVPFDLEPLAADERARDNDGREHITWDVDGWVIFAEDPAGFWARLPDCQRQQREALRVVPVGEED